MAEKTRIESVGAEGRKLSIARRALAIQNHFVSLPESARVGLLTIRQCVEAIAADEGWADNRARIELTIAAAEQMKVNR